MLDFITSKIAMIMATVFILLVALGVYEIQKNAIEEEELKNIADKIATTIDELSALQANAKVNLTFYNHGEGIYLKPKVGDDIYEIRFTPNLIFLTQHGRSISSNLIGAIHIWKPNGNEYNCTGLEELDIINRVMKVKSGDNIVITVERRQIELSGLLEYHTFIYTSLL